MSMELTTLPNGLRIATDFVPSVDSVAVGVWADVGTRHEDRAENGIAHMVEHMMFKGTPTRTAVQIAEQIEDVGGQMNAYTSREITSYHMHLLKEDLSLGLEILADLLQRPTMPEDEVERERQVILQEIGMAADTPDDLVFDLYQETTWPDQTLGAPILGLPRIVEAMKRDALLNYVRRFYTPSRLVIAVAGNAKHDAVVRLAEKFFDALPPDTAHAIPTARYQGGERRMGKELEQSHVILGFKGVDRGSDDYHAAMILSTILGGGMSSRLFQEVREKRGLVYSVFSHHAPYHDAGQFMIYAGTGPGSLPDLMPVLCAEIRKIRGNPVSGEELKRAKAQIRAELLMGQESMMRRAGHQAKHLIHFGTLPDMKDRLQRIEAVTADDVEMAAQKIFSSPLVLTALGPLSTLEDYESLAMRLAA